MDGSLNYCTIMHLEQYCQWLDKWDEICYINAFISLYNRVLSGTENHLMVQRREVALKPPPDGKTQGGREDEELHLINVLSPDDTGFVAGGSSSPPPPSQTAHEGETTEPTAPPLYDEGCVSPSKTHQSTQFGQGASVSGARQFPLRQYPVDGVYEQSQPASYDWAHTPFSTSDLLNYKNSNPSYRDDPQKIADLVISIFATHHPNWADV